MFPMRKVAGITFTPRYKPNPEVKIKIKLWIDILNDSKSSIVLSSATLLPRPNLPLQLHESSSPVDHASRKISLKFHNKAKTIHCDQDCFLRTGESTSVFVGLSEKVSEEQVQSLLNSRSVGWLYLYLTWFSGEQSVTRLVRIKI